MKHRISLIIILVLCDYFEAVGQSYSDSLTQELEKHYERSSIPGFAVAIVNKDGTLYQHGFGLANKLNNKKFKPNTVQNLGSVSKAVVGLALVKAIENEELSMDAPVNVILPFEVMNPHFKDHPILVRHLADHTSTILDSKHYGKTYVLHEDFEIPSKRHEGYLNFLRSHSPMELEDFLYEILNSKGKWYHKKNFLKKEPGTISEYSNLNAALMAYLIQVATKTPFEEYTKKTIFNPLKMSSTQWKIDTQTKELSTPYFPSGIELPLYRLITYPDGGLYSSVADLAKLLREIINAYSGKSKYLPPKYAKMLLPGDNDSDRAFWGMGIKSRNIGHGGSDPGVQTDLQFNADSKIGRIIIANVNAEDDDTLWSQYREIHKIIAKYEEKISE